MHRMAHDSLFALARSSMKRELQKIPHSQTPGRPHGGLRAENGEAISMGFHWPLGGGFGGFPGSSNAADRAGRCKIDS